VLQKGTVMKKADNPGIGMVLDFVKDVSILYDNNRDQYSVKLPKELCEIFSVKKRDSLRFIVEIREGEPVKGRFEIVHK